MRVRYVALALGAASAVLASSQALAQCPNITGNPAPQAAEYAANYVKLRYLATGPGGGDDRPELYKSAVTAPLFSFDPVNTHDMHVTITKNTIGGPLLWSADVPSSSTLWTATTLSNGNVRYQYTDPNVTFGVSSIRVVKYTMLGLYNVTYFRGKNQSITNAPLIAGTDQAHVIVEMEYLGSGLCYDGQAARCTGSGNTQKCYVQ